jgi:hypothetical protein
MEVKKNQRLIVHPKLIRMPADLIFGQVPWGQIGSLVEKDKCPLEPGRPVIQVFLICEPTVF